jgi:hypothetical protein
VDILIPGLGILQARSVRAIAGRQIVKWGSHQSVMTLKVEGEHEKQEACPSHWRADQDRIRF